MLPATHSSHTVRGPRLKSDSLQPNKPEPSHQYHWRQRLTKIGRIRQGIEGPEAPSEAWANGTNLRAVTVCDRDLEINSMTLKLEGDLSILKIYLHTENEAASLQHSKLRA